ncbi:MAG: 2-iminoacetate synthase ThiH [Candidatus Omnitrophica bacterium]|nr:2-iminoacetate synthase ThiH [Candidatus Omnitrophota bacterium]MBU1996944.1 2-iminoacetate synthase ThiH [Candidatus Omnitrophota bacterium]MBU4333949.1 2-iminoacetate synthase ThiH [Candidatus Omnitrophota bacterium]
MITQTEINDILNDKSPESVEALANAARQMTEQYFGRTISLYAPLYLSNYCSSQCTYCGFTSHNRINRIKLTSDQMHKEMSYIANTGIENILLLTGESPQSTPLSYLKEAVTIAKQYFPSISLEIYPMETEEYKELYFAGVDGVTIYQETYDKTRYKEVHIAGKKSDYDYRLSTPQRIAEAGIRHISLGILLGLSDVAYDLCALYSHLKKMENTFPGVEYSLSYPRLRKIKGQDFAICDIDDITFIKIICLTRTLFPRVGINLSTRENPLLRDHAISLGITKMSAGSTTCVGGYNLPISAAQDPQFDVEDTRSVREVVNMLKSKNYDPVLTDWRRIENQIS